MLARVSRWWWPVVVVTLLWSLLSAWDSTDTSRLAKLLDKMPLKARSSVSTVRGFERSYQRIAGRISEVSDVDAPLPDGATAYDGAYSAHHYHWSWREGFWASTHRLTNHGISVQSFGQAVLYDEAVRDIIARFKADAVSRGMMTTEIVACIDQQGRNCVMRVPYWPGIALNVAWAASIGLVVLRVGCQMANRKWPNSK